MRGAGIWAALALLVACFAGAEAFAGAGLPALHGSSFTAASASSSLPLASSKNVVRKQPMDLKMGKVSAVGPFTPVVVATRAVVGDKRFNQIRGKAITYHSQVITEFSNYAGVTREMRQGLIKLAKANGNILGFLS